jgi:inner membrane transporter RhtA
MIGQGRTTAVGLVLAGTLSVQFGAVIATGLFDDVGTTGTVLLRTGFAALILTLLWRPRPREHPGGSLRLAVAYGVVLAAMNLSFYAALDRIHLGIAVTLEFVGPFGVAVAMSRRGRDLLWVALAAAGILLLSPVGGGSPDGLGVAFALLAGIFWAAYILLAVRLGRAFPRGDGLAIAMVVSALVLLPAGVAGGGAELVTPAVLGAGIAIAVLSSLIPYSAELEALRRLPEGTFGVLMSLEPAVAALAGLAFLGQALSAQEVLAIVLVVCASAGALGSAGAPAPVEA